jgi:hypothetical protein
LIRELSSLEREKEKTILHKCYLNEASKIIAREKGGDALFSALLQAIDKVTQEWDKKPDTAVEVENTIRMDMNSFHREFHESYRFVNGPTTPDTPARSRIPIVIVGASIRFPWH